MKKRVLNITGSLGGGINSVISSISKDLSTSHTVKCYILRKTNGISIFKWLEKFIYIKKLMKDEDIIHYHGGWLMAIALLFKKPKASLVISPHGALNKVSLRKSRFKKIIVKYIYMKRAYLNADIIHALTAKEAQDIRDWGVKDIPIEVIPNGIDFKECLDMDIDFQNRLKALAKGRRVFLSLSRLHKAKGIEMLIDALSLVDSKQFCLFIVGEGTQKYEEYLNEKIKNLSLENSIYLLGALFNKEKSSVYNIADIFILPSFNEGFPLTVLEAYRQKTPVITTTATPFDWIVSSECGWYIEPTKSELVKALDSALSNSIKSLDSMGNNGYSYTKKNYKIEIVAEKYRLMYNKITKKAHN